MKLPSYQFVAQMGAAFAVVASLALVVSNEPQLLANWNMAQIYESEQQSL